MSVTGNCLTLSAVEADTTVLASFRRAATQPPEERFTIQSSCGSGGTISPSGAAAVEYGGDAYYCFIPDAGYETADVRIDGTAVPTNGNDYRLSGVTAPHTIQVSFRPIAAPTPTPANGRSNPNTGV